jgi:hypothetical protein
MNRLVSGHSFATLATFQPKNFSYKDPFQALSFNQHYKTAWFPSGIPWLNKHNKLIMRKKLKGVLNWKLIGSGFLP